MAIDNTRVRAMIVIQIFSFLKFSLFFVSKIVNHGTFNFSRRPPHIFLNFLENHTLPIRSFLARSQFYCGRREHLIALRLTYANLAVIPQITIE